MAVNGWPARNEMAEQRNFLSHPEQRLSLLMPRGKWTFLVQFDINPAVFTAAFQQTSLAQHIQNGKLYIHLRSIDLPKTQFETETLNAYNKKRIINKKIEYPACSMSFFDDSTSMVASLHKEYLNFIHETGDIGLSSVRGASPIPDNYKHAENDSIINPSRSEMDRRPSLGMKLHGDNERTFFNNIIVYNLGTDPDSINVYYFYKPVVTSIEYDPLDYEDRTMSAGVNFSFEAESYYFTIGQPRDGSVAEALQRFDPNTNVGPNRASDHAVMGTGSDGGNGVLGTIGNMILGFASNAADAFGGAFSPPEPTVINWNTPAPTPGNGQFDPNQSSGTMPPMPGSTRTVVR